MKRLSVCLMYAVTALTLATPAMAQEGRGAGQGSGAGAAGTSDPNIRLDVTISDQTVDGAPVKKSISLILANGGSGRVRSAGTMTEPLPPGDTPGRPAFFNNRTVQLNLDAEVVIRGDNKIRTLLTLEYTPGGETPSPPPGTFTRSPLNQSVTVNLTSGQPLMITQAADPLSDRKVTVEVTATILR
jgi:hypothetical protein